MSVALEPSRGPEGHSAHVSEYVQDPGAYRRVGFVEPVLIGRILTLGLPVIIGMLTQTAINIVDTMFVGRLPQELAVAGTAALGPSLVLLWAFGGFLCAISVGTQALTARRFGAGDVRGAGRVLTNSAATALLSSIVVTGIAILLVGPIFAKISPDHMVQEVGTSFCRIRFLGIFSMVLMASYKSFYDGIGSVRVHMTIAIVMNILNLFLCWLLVFGNFGLPRLEVDGAAWSAVLSSSAGLVMIVAWSLRKGDRDAFRVYRWSNLDAAVAKSVAKLSFWSGMATTFVMTGFGLFLWIVGLVDAREGSPGVNASATSVIINISMLVFMTCIAFGTSTATLVSQSLGAKQPNLASRYGWQSVLLIVLLMTGVGAVMSLFPEPLLRAFLPAEASQNETLKDAVVAVAAHSLRFCGFLAPITAGALVLTQALYGAGESRFVMQVELVLHFVCLVPLAYFFAVGLGLGLIGCWYATAVYGTALLAATGIKFYRGSWKKTVI
jgi:multidrug resistance protein, MATE family